MFGRGETRVTPRASELRATCPGIQNSECEVAPRFGAGVLIREPARIIRILPLFAVCGIDCELGNIGKAKTYERYGNIIAS